MDLISWNHKGSFRLPPVGRSGWSPWFGFQSPVIERNFSLIEDQALLYRLNTLKFVLFSTGFCLKGCSRPVSYQQLVLRVLLSIIFSQLYLKKIVLILGGWCFFQNLLMLNCDKNLLCVKLVYF